jgi:hypothetical protein
MTCFGHNPYRGHARSTWRWILATLSLSCLLAGVDLLLSCSSGATTVRTVETVAAPAARAAVPPPPPPADTRDADAQLKQARQLMDDHDTAAATQHAEDAARIHGLEGRLDQLADDAGRARLGWTAGILIAAGIAFGILVFVLPAGRRWPALASVGAFAGATLALILRAIYGWLTWIGAALGGGFVLYAAWQLARTKRAAVAAAAHGDQVESSLRVALQDLDAAPIFEDVVKAVKNASATRQGRGGHRPSARRDPRQAAQAAGAAVRRPQGGGVSLVSSILTQALAIVSNVRGESLGYRTTTSGSFTALTGFVLDWQDAPNPSYDERLGGERRPQGAFLSGPTTPALAVGYQVQDASGNVWAVKAGSVDAQQQIWTVELVALGQMGPDRRRTT